MLLNFIDREAELICLLCAQPQEAVSDPIFSTSRASQPTGSTSEKGGS
jgi:hypothetical protein